MKSFIRRALATFGIRWLTVLVTVLITLIGAAVQYVFFWGMEVPLKRVDWLLVIFLPFLLAPPLLYVLLNQFRQLDQGHRELLASQQKLQQALAEVKDLQGLLSMCAGCKKIRNAEDEWTSVDLYLQHHTNADVSHGLCPDCAKKYHSPN